MDIAFLGGAVIGLAALWLGGTIALRASDAFVSGNDFAFVWVGPAALVQGADPYDPATWRATTARLGASGTREGVYDYPPWTALALLPLGVLPLPVAAALWAYGGLGIALVAMLLLARDHLEPVPGAAFLVGLMVVVSHPAVVNFYNGEWSFVLVAALAALALGLRRGRGALGGLALLALSLKPNVTLIALPALLRAGVATGQRRFVAVTVGGGLAVLAASFVIMPGWLGPYVDLVQSTRLGNPKTTVLPYALRELLGEPGLILGVAALLVVVALALAFDPRSDGYVPAWLAVAPVVTPYLHTYDQLVVLVPVTIALGALARRRAALAYGLAAVATLDLVVISKLLYTAPAQALGRETLNGLVHVPLVLLVLAALWRDRGGQPRDVRARPSA